MKKTLCSYFLTVDKNYELSVEKISTQGLQASGGGTMKRYIFHVFADGSDELVDIGGEAPEESANTPEEKAPSAKQNSTISISASAKTYQTLMVLDYIWRNKEQYKKPNGEPDAENALRSGIKYAAKQCDLPVSTVMDKFLRQMGTNIQQWRNYVSEWLKTGDFSPIEVFLSEQIEKKGSDRTRKNDRDALACFVETVKATPF